MSTYQPFVGEHAEYYKRRAVRDVISSARQLDPIALENEYLHQKVAQLEGELSAYKERDQKQELLSNTNVILRFLRWLRAVLDINRLPPGPPMAR